MRFIARCKIADMARNKGAAGGKHGDAEIKGSHDHAAGKRLRLVVGVSSENKWLIAYVSYWNASPFPAFLEKLYLTGGGS